MQSPLLLLLRVAGYLYAYLFFFLLLGFFTFFSHIIINSMILRKGIYHKKMKKFALVIMALCILETTGCSSSMESMVNAAIPVSAEVLSSVSIANGTAIKNVNKTDNQLYVSYEDGDTLTYAIFTKLHPVSISLNMNYVSSQKKSADFVFNIMKEIIGEEYESQMPDKMKDELSNAIENDSSATWKFQTGDYTVNVEFQQTGNMFNLNIGY